MFDIKLNFGQFATDTNLVVELTFFFFFFFLLFFSFLFLVELIDDDETGARRSLAARWDRICLAPNGSGAGLGSTRTVFSDTLRSR